MRQDASETISRDPALSSGRADRRGWAGGSLTIGLALFVGLSLARVVVVDGLGDRLAANQPRLALSMGRDSPDVLSAVAEGHLRAKDYRGAARLSLAALSRSPLNVRALRVRAMALEGQGETPKARALFQFAGSRGWRDNEVQAWLLRDGLRDRQYAEAFRHADALARRHEELRPVLFTLFAVAAANPDAADALAARLATRPEWRPAFLDDLAHSPQKDDAVGGLFRNLDRGPAPLSFDELGDYPQRLAREGRYRDAFAALRSFKGGRAMAQIPFDGEFSNRQGVAPFTWDKIGTVGVTLDFAAAPDRLDQSALRVAYDGFSSTDLLQQTLALEPGDYRLTGEVYQEEGDARRLAWTVRCIAGGRSLATISANLTGSAVWRPFDGDFTVPETQCDGVRLLLTGAPGPRRSSITVWYDNIRISKVGAPTPSTLAMSSPSHGYAQRLQ